MAICICLTVGFLYVLYGDSGTVEGVPYLILRCGIPVVC